MSGSTWAMLALFAALTVGGFAETSLTTPPGVRPGFGTASRAAPPGSLYATVLRATRLRVPALPVVAALRP